MAKSIDVVLFHINLNKRTMVVTEDCWWQQHRTVVEGQSMVVCDRGLLWRPSATSFLLEFDGKMSGGKEGLGGGRNFTAFAVMCV